MEKNEYRIMHDIERTYWWFRGKQFLIDVFLKRYLSESKDNKLLDIGCGTGIILELMKKHGSGYGIELSALGIKMLKQKNLNLLVQSDANRPMPFKDDVFSAITCLDVLEHLDSDFELLKEMVRICKPGGVIVITVPAMRFLWSIHDEALHHKRRYTKKQLLNRIGALNCTVVKSSYFNSCLFFPIAFVRLMKSLFRDGKVVKSDFFMALPKWLNRTLYFFYSTELNCLRFTTIPFGLSVLLIVQKPETN